MEPHERLDDFTAKAVKELGRVIERVGPDVVLVQGDATTAMAGAMAAYYQKVPVGHIEAGLRTGHPYSPFPEEINRRIISSVAKFHFAPTRKAADALLSEGISFSTIFIVGNTVIDALESIRVRLTQVELNRFQFNGRKLILLTSNRRENFGDPLRRICRAASQIVPRNRNVEILFPLHPDRNVRSVVGEMLEGVDRVHLCDALSYREWVMAMSQCHLILTDSGGIQEEAPSLGKPVLVLRDRTERLEAIEANTAKLVGSQTERIVHETESLLNGSQQYTEMARPRNLYGDGLAAKRIVSILVEETCGSAQPGSDASAGAPINMSRPVTYVARLLQLLRFLPHSETGRRWVIFDVLAGLCSAILAFAVSGHLGDVSAPHIGLLPGAAAWTVALLIAAHLFGLHYPHSRLSLFYETTVLAVFSVILAAGIEVVFLSAVLYQRIGRRILWAEVLFGLVLLVTIRVFFLRWLRARPKRVLVYSPCGQHQELIQLVRESEAGYEFVGCVRDDPGTGMLDCRIDGLLGHCSDLLAVCRKTRAQEIIYCNAKLRSPAADSRVTRVLEDGIPATMSWQFCERLFRYTPCDMLPPDWPIYNVGSTLSDPYRFFRSAADVTAALLLGALLSPVWLLTALAIRVIQGKAVIYRQARVGIGGKQFLIYKFRTMKDSHDHNGREGLTHKNDPRVSLLGRIIRKTRIDELPQLLNILKGDMVLIGPRPEQPSFVAEYEKELPFYAYRHLVKPGITGWAQVKYRYTNDLEGTRKKLGYDLYYIRHISPKLDIEIALRTIVFLMRGAV